MLVTVRLPDADVAHDADPTEDATGHADACALDDRRAVAVEDRAVRQSVLDITGPRGHLATHGSRSAANSAGHRARRVLGELWDAIARRCRTPEPRWVGSVQRVVADIRVGLPRRRHHWVTGEKLPGRRVVVAGA